MELAPLLGKETNATPLIFEVPLFKTNLFLVGDSTFSGLLGIETSKITCYHQLRTKAGFPDP